MKESLPVETKYFKSFDECNIRYIQLQASNPIGNVILIQGRSTFIEQYLESFSLWLQRGYNVWMMDLRGQGGSERQINHPQKNHINDFQLYVDDLHFFVNNIVEQQNVILYAISLGSHIAIRYLQVNSAPISSAILLSPLFSVELSWFDRYFIKRVLPIAKLLGTSHLYTPGYGDFALNQQHTKIYDKIRYQDYISRCKQFPEYVTGGPTIAWVLAMFSSLQKVTTTKLNVPLFVAIAEYEDVVDNIATMHFCKYQDSVLLIEYKAAYHNILLCQDEIVNKLWNDIDMFLKSL